MEEKELLRQNTNRRVEEISIASHKLLLKVSAFLRTCYREAIPSDRFVDFLCAVFSTDASQNGKVYPPIIDRKELIGKNILSPEAQRRIEQMPLSQLNSMENRDFCRLLRQGLPAVPDDETRRRLLRLADLAALFKMNILLRDASGQRAGGAGAEGGAVNVDFYEMLRARFRTRFETMNVSRSAWVQRNRKALDLRNSWGGHINEETFRSDDGETCITAGQWRGATSAWLNVAAPLLIEETKAEYQQIVDVINEADSKMQCRLVPLQELAGQSGRYTAGQVKAILSEHYRYQCSGDMLFCDPDEALSCLRDHARLQSMQDEIRKLREELRHAKAEAPASAEKILREYLLRQSGPAKFERLLSYTGGSMDRRGLRELADTHTIVLDPSLLKRREGRRFVMEQLCPILQRDGRSPRSCLMVESTALCHLMKGYQEFRSAWEKLRALPKTPACDPERRRLTERCEELTGAKAAYLFVRDELKLPPTGIPDPMLSDEQSLLEFLNDHPTRYFCVLTCGATGLVKGIRRDRTPLVSVGRVRSAGEAVVCSIFPQFLPFAKPEDAREGLNRLAEKAGEEPSDGEAEPLAAPDTAGPAQEPEALAAREAPTAPAQTSPGKDGPDTAVRHGSEPFPPDLPLRVMDETPLPLRAQPRVGDVLRTEEGQAVTLRAPLMEGGEEARGGEGAVYETSLPGQVAKVYFADHLTAGRRDKLTEMLRHDPGIDGLCWPTHLLYSEAGEFVGYTMRRAPETAMPFSKSVLKIGSPSQRKAYMADWTRSDLVRAARGAARLLAGLHRSNILMGDVNAGNFMVDLRDSSRVYAVDTDSFQLGGYPCPVGFEDFTHPGTAARLGTHGALCFGTFLRTREEEEYALAILLFEILFLGVNPFVTKSEMTYLEAMRSRNFSYANTEDWMVPDGDNWMIWKNLPRKLTDAFTATFAEWKTTSAENWAKLLDTYLYSIRHYNFSDELAPVKYHEFHPENPVYVDVKCAYCGREFNVHKKRHADLVRSGRPAYCRECTNFLTLHRDEPYPEQMKCSRCGARFSTTVGDAFNVEAGVEPALCPDCRTPETECAGCGKKFRIPYIQLDRLNEKKAPAVCRECRGSETVTCESCGKQYVEKTWKARRNRRLGLSMYCDGCRAQEDVQCAVCGQTYQAARWRVLKNQRENWPDLCDACRRLQYVTVPCDECGAETTVPLSVFRGRRHNGQKVLCSSCHRNTFR